MIKSGIYMIQSLKFPDRVYVGSAYNIRRRWNSHIYYLRNNNHHSPKLQNHYNKYGESDLMFDIIESRDYLCNEDILAREQGWCYHFQYQDTWKPYFNICPQVGNVAGRPSRKKGVPSGVVPWNKGKKNVYSEETLKEMATGRKGKEPWNKGKHGYLSEEVLQKMRHPLSEEHKQKLSKAHMGVPLSEEHTQHAKAARKLKYPHHSEETKRKIGDAQKGEKNHMFGKKQTKEANAKRSESLKKTWALRKLGLYKKEDNDKV